MDPSLGLLAASGLVNFLLKTTAEWLVCLLLVRIAGTARVRFNLWLAMLLGFVAQWVWVCARILRAALPAVAHTAGVAGVTAAGLTSAGGARIAVAGGIAGTVAQSMAVLLACYLLIVLWRMIGTLVVRFRLARAMRHKSAPELQLATSFYEAMEQTAGRGNELRGCELWVLPGLPSPATLGWWRPRVIVPPVCQTQDEAELQVVFWHELMHVERRDALWNAMVRACRNLLWFHPCVHHAAIALNAQRELACDAAVVREHPQSRDVYASCLLRFARARDLAPELAVSGIEMASSAALLTTRVRSILSEAQGASRVSRVGRTTVSILLVGVMVATVPALNVLFAAELDSPAVLFPSRGDVQAVATKRSLKSAGAKVQGVASLRSVAGTETPGTSLTLQHDDGLAAEHRAAMDILSESTGMDAAATGSDGRSIAGLTGPGRGNGSGAQSSPSWTSVAVDAAERMGPLMGDHDGDGHHYR
jgi:beta-lactamase regulating signal transducer with metallopeptidase domain